MYKKTEDLQMDKFDFLIKTLFNIARLAQRVSEKLCAASINVLTRNPMLNIHAKQPLQVLGDKLTV